MLGQYLYTLADGTRERLGIGLGLLGIGLGFGLGQYLYTLAEGTRYI
jgi:hypothetical protein